MKIIDGIASENLNRPDLIFADVEKAAMQKYDSAKYKGKRKRITINKKMFLEVDEAKEEAITRMPYKKNEYIVLPMEDCAIFGDGEVLSAYIYENGQYKIVDGNKSLICVQDGKTVMESYEAKKELRKNRNSK